MRSSLKAPAILTSPPRIDAYILCTLGRLNACGRGATVRRMMSLPVGAGNWHFFMAISCFAVAGDEPSRWVWSKTAAKHWPSGLRAPPGMPVTWRDSMTDWRKALKPSASGKSPVLFVTFSRVRYVEVTCSLSRTLFKIFCQKND